MKLLILFALALASASAGKPRDGRIINGLLAPEGEFPFQVGLSLIKNGTSWCGGSLISNEWILTAAHCLQGIPKGIAYLGSTIRKQAIYEIPFTSKDVIIHELYNHVTIEQDIALLHIKPVKLVPGVSTIEMEAGPSQYENNIATAVGWGRTSDTSAMSPNLYYIRLVITPVATCRKVYGSLPDSVICVSTKASKSTCQGDSGGPLIADNKLIGVTSFGYGNRCEAGFPVVFSRVSSFIAWIKHKTGIKN